MKKLVDQSFNPLFIGSRFVTVHQDDWTCGRSHVSIPYSSGLGL